MQNNRKLAKYLLAMATLVVLASTPATAAGEDRAPLGFHTGPFEDARVLHLLRRAAFGPTPELVEEVHRLGRARWVAQQLEPETIEDPELEARLALYPSLTMDATDLLANYPRQNNQMPMGIGPPQQVPFEVAAASVTRAVHGKAQLNEVLTDFWFNHFNVSAEAGPVRLAVVSYVRDTIRPHAMGYFRDLLRATSESVAMLYYLDNYANVAPGSRGRRSGTNENYARELLELHTLGIEGGYTETDIQEVAKAFTGWTFTNPNTGTVEFVFVPRLHVGGDKTVLGRRIASGGQDEGIQILDMLASHPSTARFIATKLLRRFLTDDPAPELVERVADTFLATGGHIGWTVATILLSDEFQSPAYRLKKTKTPLELIASALRATGAEVGQGVGAARLIGNLGQPMLKATAPTGWPETASGILSPGGMSTRFEAGYLLATNNLPGVRIDDGLWAPIVELWGIEGLAQYLLGRPAGALTRAALEKAAGEGAAPALLAALVLASPEFQQQ